MRGIAATTVLCINFNNSKYSVHKIYILNNVCSLQSVYHIYLNARWLLSQMTPQKNMYAKRRCIYPNLRRPHQKQKSAKNILLIISHLIYFACWILSTFTNQCHCLHLHSQCFHLPHIHCQHSHPLHCHSTTYHQCHPLHWIHSTTENHHSYYWWDALPCCYDPHWQTNTCIFLGL